MEGGWVSRLTVGRPHRGSKAAFGNNSNASTISARIVLPSSVSAMRRLMLNWRRSRIQEPKCLAIACFTPPESTKAEDGQSSRVLAN